MTLVLVYLQTAIYYEQFMLNIKVTHGLRLNNGVESEFSANKYGTVMFYGQTGQNLNLNYN